MPASLSKTIALIAGAGPGTGAAISRRFAKAYPVVLLARNQETLDSIAKDINQNGGSAIGFATDATSSSSMNETFSKIEEKFGPDFRIAAAIYNVAARFQKSPFLEQNLDDFMKQLDPTIKGAFNFAQAALPRMINPSGAAGEHPPTLIFTGATAALKAGSGLSAFAMSKFGIRAMSQSLAREFGPQGVHVSHAVIDGLIDTEATKAYPPHEPDAKIAPDQIAESYWYLHTQPRSAFTQELDLRPFSETW
ncbi:oxidoreductase [Acrodontium crateriforme]|uniref:Oxidoreductase n=1 Tax=Acrodontium crateriforme TaxID=150365 RepID=A0AAQ3LYJ0_9PEZI|nr:oxidoreductase [Acrodontium crateriforme]